MTVEIEFHERGDGSKIANVRIGNSIYAMTCEEWKCAAADIVAQISAYLEKEEPTNQNTKEKMIDVYNTNLSYCLTIRFRNITLRLDWWYDAGSRRHKHIPLEIRRLPAPTVSLRNDP